MGSNGDRVVGTMVTVMTALVAAYACHYLLLRSSSNNNNKTNRKKVKMVEDNYYRTRYHALERREEYVWHQGSCHCMRVQFNIFAPPILHAVDVPSKLRFPRLSINADDLQLLCDESNLSLYSIENAESSVGGYSFCSFCGMQILYAPYAHPQELQINLDCLSTDTIAELHIAYHSAGEALPSQEPPRYLYNNHHHGGSGGGHGGVHPHSSSIPVFYNAGTTQPSYQRPPMAYNGGQQYLGPPPQELSIDAPQSDITEDIYSRASIEESVAYNHRDMAYKYSIDGDNDTMSSHSYHTRDSRRHHRGILNGGGSRRSVSSLLSDDMSLSSYAGYTRSVGVAASEAGLDEGLDVATLYPTLKKYMQRHV